MTKPKAQVAPKKAGQTYKERRAKVAAKVTREGIGGRPTLYKPEYCDMVIEHMAEGASLASFAGFIRVSRSAIAEWEVQHPKFSQAADVGRSLCAAWWEKTGRDIARNGGGTGSATMCVFGLKNMARGDWQEKSQQELSGPDGAPVRAEVKVVIDEATEARIAARLLGE